MGSYSDHRDFCKEQRIRESKSLDAGADDYITKPFGNQELLARIRTALRHRRQPMGAETKTPMYHAGQLKIDFDKRRVFLGEEEIRLTQIEYKLVSLLAENAGKVITYESIIKDIWGPHADTNNRILRVNMANIRRKIEKIQQFQSMFLQKSESDTVCLRTN